MRKIDPEMTYAISGLDLIRLQSLVARISAPDVRLLPGSRVLVAKRMETIIDDMKEISTEGA